MKPSESDVSRLLAAERPVDDPGLSEVAGFLADLRQAYPPASVEGVRESHLAAIAQHARHQPAPPSRRRRVAHRRTAVVSLAAFSVFTAGVGVAAAMGVDPLTVLPGLRLGPPTAARSATPQPPASPSAPPSAAPPAGPRQQPPGVGVSSSRRPTPMPSAGIPTKGDPSWNNGRSDEAKAEHKPTAMPTQAKNDKANNDKAKPPAKGRSSQKPTPPSKRGRTDG